MVCSLVVTKCCIVCVQDPNGMDIDITFKRVHPITHRYSFCRRSSNGVILGETAQSFIDTM